MHRIRRAGAESVALCLLFSFANPMNERRMARALERLGIPISVSHEILPEFREYERLSTVVINAFLAPRVGQYLTSLERLAARQFSKGVTRVFIMQSSGGITTAARAAREPVRTILSGPAGGVVAAEWLAGQMGLPRAISFDMGGTSTDVCLIEGVPRTTRETTVGGLPVAVPVLDVHSVGAGGGSIARFDRGGALRVGPESAGSLPGPACYGRGGRLPTVTDAHVTLGRLHPAHFLGGSYTLSRDAAEQAFAKLLRHSHARFKSKLELAQGVVAVANANMERALRVISVERGHDPRDFSLIAFGGAGGLHAADLARALGLARVIVPRHPGAFSALGILTSDIVKDVSRSVLRAVPDSRREMPAFLHELEAGYRQLESAARAELRQEQSGTARPAVTRTLDVRYHGQAYELTLPFAADFAAQFHRDHERAYGYAHAGRALEVVSLRVRLTLPTPKPPRLRPRQAGRRQLSDAVVAVQPVWFESRAWETPFFNREKLGPGMRFQGPAVILEYSSTTVVPPDFLCVVDGRRNLVLQKVPDS
jgi:N-methylhydantoinase A